MTENLHGPIDSLLAQIRADDVEQREACDFCGPHGHVVDPPAHGTPVQQELWWPRNSPTYQVRAERVAALIHHQGWEVPEGWKPDPEECDTCDKAMRVARAILAETDAWWLATGGMA